MEPPESYRPRMWRAIGSQGTRFGTGHGWHDIEDWDLRNGLRQKTILGDGSSGDRREAVVLSNFRMRKVSSKEFYVVSSRPQRFSGGFFF